MTQPAPQVFTPNVRFFRAYGFHTYNWSTYYQPTPAGSSNPITTFGIAAEPSDPTSVNATINANVSGTLTISWGTRSGAYSGRTTPVPAVAGTPITLRITGLKRKTQYFFNAQISVNVPSPGGGLPTVGNYTSGETTFTTT